MKMRCLILAVCLVLSPLGIARDYSKIFKKVDPAVVVIYTEANKSTITQKGVATASQTGLGSGVLISAEGRILTAAHVVNDADNIEVRRLLSLRNTLVTDQDYP